MRRPSGTSTSPLRTRARVDSWVIARPANVTLPPEGLTSPSTARSSDDLRAPLAPRTATVSPLASWTDTPRTACTRPYRTSRSCTSSCTVPLHRLGDRRAEIGLLDQRVLTDLLGPAFGNLTTEIEDDHLLAQRPDEVYVVLDDHQGPLAPRPEFLELRLQSIGFRRIEARSRFVEPKQPRLRHELAHEL